MNRYSCFQRCCHCGLLALKFHVGQSMLYLLTTVISFIFISLQLKDNPTLSGFFQRMTYSSFQKLADAYLETEVTPTHSLPTIPHTAPELIKLAFTYDFTAKVARLSRQNVGHITGLGNRYLEDRFEYKQVRNRHNKLGRPCVGIVV